MATVTKEFKQLFDRWANMKTSAGHFTPEEMADLRELIRQDIKPGPDMVRVQLATMVNDAGRKMLPIDDVNERIELWQNYWRDEVAAMED